MSRHKGGAKGGWSSADNTSLQLRSHNSPFVSESILQKFWDSLDIERRRDLLTIDKQTFFDSVRKGAFCARCHGLLVEGFSTFVLFDRKLGYEDASEEEQLAIRDPVVSPWGGLEVSHDCMLTVEEHFLDSPTLVFESARERARERELACPDACGGGRTARIPALRERCPLHRTRVSREMLIDFWHTLTDMMRASLLQMMEDDFVELLTLRFEAKRICKECRRNVLRELKEIKELNRSRREIRCNETYCTADGCFPCEVSGDTIHADWECAFGEVTSYDWFEWVVGPEDTSVCDPNACWQGGAEPVMRNYPGSRTTQNVGQTTEASMLWNDPSSELALTDEDLEDNPPLIVTVRGWHSGGTRCVERSVRAVPMNGRACAHVQLRVAEGMVVLVDESFILQMFDQMDDDNEEEDMDYFDDAYESLDDPMHEMLRNGAEQQHAGSPELARDFLMNAAGAIFRDQVEKALREQTARQNAHNLFVSLAAALLEERIHIACAEVGALLLQQELLEEEEAEKKEEDLKREKKRAKERNKKQRRKEKRHQDATPSTTPLPLSPQDGEEAAGPDAGELDEQVDPDGAESELPTGQDAEEGQEDEDEEEEEEEEEQSSDKEEEHSGSSRDGEAQAPEEPAPVTANGGSQRCEGPGSTAGKAPPPSSKDKAAEERATGAKSHVITSAGLDATAAAVRAAMQNLSLPGRASGSADHSSGGRGGRGGGSSVSGEHRGSKSHHHNQHHHNHPPHQYAHWPIIQPVPAGQGGAPHPQQGPRLPHGITALQGPGGVPRPELLQLIPPNAQPSPIQPLQASKSMNSLDHMQHAVAMPHDAAGNGWPAMPPNAVRGMGPTSAQQPPHPNAHPARALPHPALAQAPPGTAPGPWAPHAHPAQAQRQPSPSMARGGKPGLPMQQPMQAPSQPHAQPPHPNMPRQGHAPKGASAPPQASSALPPPMFLAHQLAQQQRKGQAQLASQAMTWHKSGCNGWNCACGSPAGEKGAGPRSQAQHLRKHDLTQAMAAFGAQVQMGHLAPAAVAQTGSPVDMAAWQQQQMAKQQQAGVLAGPGLAGGPPMVPMHLREQQGPLPHEGGFPAQAGGEAPAGGRVATSSQAELALLASALLQQQQQQQQQQQHLSAPQHLQQRAPSHHAQPQLGRHDTQQPQQQPRPQHPMPNPQHLQQRGVSPHHAQHQAQQQQPRPQQHQQHQQHQQQLVQHLWQQQHHQQQTHGPDMMGAMAAHFPQPQQQAVAGSAGRNFAPPPPQSAMGSAVQFPPEPHLANHAPEKLAENAPPPVYASTPWDNPEPAPEPKPSGLQNQAPAGAAQAADHTASKDDGSQAGTGMGKASMWAVGGGLTGVGSFSLFGDWGSGLESTQKNGQRETIRQAWDSAGLGDPKVPNDLLNPFQSTAATGPGSMW